MLSLMSILDHLTLSVADVARSRAFYEPALAPLDITVVKAFGEEVPWGPAIAFGKAGQPAFWLFAKEQAQLPMHIAFTASSRALVRAFHQAALAAGAKDNGAPGVREIYHPDYYGAFAIDPDGHNIEAVCRLPLAGAGE